MAIVLASATQAAATTIVLSPTQDGRIYTANGGDTVALATLNDAPAAPGLIEHSLLQFNLSSIPAGTVTANATLTLIHDSAIQTSGQPMGTESDLYAVAVPWNTTADLAAASTGNPWTTAGGDVTGGIFAANPKSFPTVPELFR